MSTLRLILSSLTFHWRINAAVALGVAAATAVLTGALVVGDSMRGSLRELTLERLGNIDEVLVAGQFFRAGLAEELEKTDDFKRDFDAAFPAILLQGTLEHKQVEGESEKTYRAGKVSVLGCDSRLWKNQRGRLPKDVAPPKTNAKGDDEIVLNQPLADELHAKVGDPIVLRLPAASEIPADSPLGRKSETIRNRTYVVSAVIPAEGLGRFAIRPSQALPHNAFVGIDRVQRSLEQRGKVNAVLVTGKTSIPNREAHDRLAASLRPQLDDFGLSLDESKLGYVQLISNRMLLDPATEKTALKAYRGLTVQPALTYLANRIAVGDAIGKLEAKPNLNGKLAGSIPYSTVTALNPAAASPLGPFTLTDVTPLKEIADDQIVLNSWAADDLARQGVELKVGDPVLLTYFDPESTHGQVTQSLRRFRLAGIVKLEGAANDSGFTPELKGVTDEDSIANWNPPFPYDASRVRSIKPNDQDDTYWKQHKATPKAFVSLATGRKLWGSRFGHTTSLRIDPAGESAKEIAARLKLEPTKHGFQLLPVKLIGLMAAAGTTPFNLLFLGFSFFIIAAAVMLIAILFRLGVDSRAKEIGVLLASGLSRRKVLGILLVEGLIVAAIGAAVGTAGGVGYAWLMIEGLRTWWLDAIVTPFLQLYATPLSLGIGYVAGVLISLLTIAWSLRQMRHVAVRQLLGGQAAAAGYLETGRHRLSAILAIRALVAALGTAAFATTLGGEAQAGAFFGAGFLVLFAGLAWIWRSLRSDMTHGGGSLAGLAVRSGGKRNPGRSTLTIGLVAAATFLIVAISAFRLDAVAEPRLDSGNGGFAVLGESDGPVYYDPGTAEGREELSFDQDSLDKLDKAEIFSLRVQSGDDASCLNLYQPTQPRMLGVPDSLIERGGFAWAGSTAASADEKANPWKLLKHDAGQRDSDGIPAVLDQNTATYSLKVGLGDTLEITDGHGQPAKLRIVGLLANSIFQGDLLLAERDLLRLFPDVSGYRYFLVDTPPSQSAAVAETLETALGDYGFDAVPTAQRLEQLMAVQNTYLSTFQSLGGLGLLLGTLGLAVVQLRSVLERRGELALMRATGFRRLRLAEMVLMESAALLLTGLAIGIAAALVAVVPAIFGGRAGMPWLSLAATLGLVLVTGLLAGLIAARATLKAPLLPALRGE